MKHPHIIQGGMGAGVSDWKLAKAVATKGGIGVVSGTALDVILTRRLEQGDIDGHMRRALAAFPDQKIASSIISRYYRPEGNADTHDFSNLPMWHLNTDNSEIEKLTVVANFVQIWLAKENHAGKVGINLLEKITLPNPAAIYGAMLADVDYIMMGAGIPIEIPGLLDSYAKGEGASIHVPVEETEKDEKYTLSFNPAVVLESPPSSLKRPAFIAIVSSYVLAVTMATRATGKVDGIVVENNTAGGHNAPPRGVLTLDDNGEPLYGAKDSVDYAKMTGLSIPFWVGGSYSNETSLEKAHEEGALGIQVGTLFAFCTESGILPELRRKFLETVKQGTAKVFTHPRISPTGYPFKMGMLSGTLSENSIFKLRKRVCNVGFLSTLFKSNDGKIDRRCPAENEAVFARKGGNTSLSTDARCLCNALLANIGLGMKYASGYLEAPLLTVGSHIESLKKLIDRFGLEYSAFDVLTFLQPETKKGTY